MGATEKGNPTVLFFFCPYAGQPPPHRFDINLGAAYLGAYLMQQGIETAFYHGAYDNDPEFGRQLDAIERLDPVIVGFTVYGSNLPETAALSKTIKRVRPQTAVVWGGPEIRYKPEKVIEAYGEWVDLCVSGEGEKPLMALTTLEHPWRNKDLTEIPGVCYHDRVVGIIQSTPLGKTLLQDNLHALERPNALDTYPSPYLEGVIPEGYFIDKTVVSIFTSRGCPFKCIYCQFSSLTDHRVHFHSVDRVLAEIEWIRSHVLAHHPDKAEVMIMIYDEALTLSKKRIEVLCRRIIDKDYDPPVRLWIDTRADHVDEALMTLLKRAGVKKVNFGLESAVPGVLKKIRKVRSQSGGKENDLAAETRFLERVRQAVKWSKALGLYTSVSMIVGLPTETMDDARETLRFVKELDVDMYYHNFLNVLEGTDLASKANKYGYEWGLRPRGYMGKYGHRYTRAPIPTRSLPLLKNARVFLRDKNRFSVLLRGWRYPIACGHPPYDRLDFAPLVLDLAMAPADYPDLCNRLFSAFAGLSTTVFYPERLALDDVLFADMLENLRLKNARLYRLPNPEKEAGRIMGIEEADQSTPYFLPFKMFDRFEDPDDGRKVFLTVNDMADAAAFIGRITSLKTEQEKVLDFETADQLEFDLFETCRWFRWNRAGCPAASLTHIYLREDLRLRPCAHFPVAGGMGRNLSLEGYRRWILAQVEKILGRRGCRKCSVRSSCPQCVAPFPLSDRQYCAFQKNYLTHSLLST
jgi:radical SAM superfamily enzyme YgiQ (UPF0313 family)